MPTLPSGGAPRHDSAPSERDPAPHPREPAPHPRDPAPYRHRGVAESFGVDAERYDRARPRYPQALIDRLTGLLAGDAHDVLDIGCGTGIVAGQLTSAGCRVLGVDPDARMAEVARTRGLAVEVASFEAWDPAGREFDAAVSGMAWHWVDPVAGATKAARLLRPGGPLCLFWNAGEPPPGLAHAFADVHCMLLPDSPAAFRRGTSVTAGYETMCDGAADAMRGTGAFGEPQRWRFEAERTYGRDEWLEQASTTGILTSLPADLRSAVLAGLGAAVDAAGGSFTMRHTTLAVVGIRTGAGVRTSSAG